MVDLRRVHLALTHLPMGTWPEPEHALSWTMSDHLLATLIDAVRELIWVTVSLQSKHKVQRPKPIWRPGSREKQKTKWTDLASLVAGSGAGVRRL